MAQRSTASIARLAAATLGLAGALGWQSTLADSLYASSSDALFSPFFTFFLATALAAACIVASPLRAYAMSAPPAHRHGWLAVAIVAGTAASIAASTQMLPPWSIYVLAAAMGVANAACAFLWAHVLEGLPEHLLVLTAFLALALASACSLALMNVSSSWNSRLAVLLFGGASLAGYLMSVMGPSEKTKDAADGREAPAPSLADLSRVKPYLRIALALSLFAAALGVTAGTTAGMASTTGVAAINIDASCATMAISVVFLALLALFTLMRRRLTFLVIVQLYAPFVVLVMLLNIVSLEWANVWLAVTIASWDVLWAITLGLVLDVARRRLLELPLVFPTWWSALNGGYAIGILVGRLVLGCAADQQTLYTVIAGVVMGVVCSIVLLLGANPLKTEPDAAKTTMATLDRAESPCKEADAVMKPQTAGTPAESLTSQAPDDVSPEALFEAIAQAGGLSAREAEVMELLVRGHTKASIASRLFISENTVRAHVKSIYSKLDVHSKQQLVDYVESFDPSAQPPSS